MVQRTHIATTADGVQLAWTRSGRGPTLVKASNWMTHLRDDVDSPVWGHWIGFLAAHFDFARGDVQSAFGVFIGQRGACASVDLPVGVEQRGVGADACAEPEGFAGEQPRSQASVLVRQTGKVASAPAKKIDEKYVARFHHTRFQTCSCA